jgi:hypothetical protein
VKYNNIANPVHFERDFEDKKESQNLVIIQEDEERPSGSRSNSESEKSGSMTAQKVRTLEKIKVARKEGR